MKVKTMISESVAAGRAGRQAGQAGQAERQAERQAGTGAAPESSHLDPKAGSREHTEHG